MAVGAPRLSGREQHCSPVPPRGMAEPGLSTRRNLRPDLCASGRLSSMIDPSFARYAFRSPNLKRSDRESKCAASHVWSHHRDSKTAGGIGEADVCLFPAEPRLTTPRTFARIANRHAGGGLWCSPGDVEAFQGIGSCRHEMGLVTSMLSLRRPVTILWAEVAVCMCERGGL